jgi:uncharacterized protein YecT (DUF1311 family)
MTIEPTPDSRSLREPAQPDLFTGSAAGPANPWTQRDWRHPTRQQIFLGGLIAAPLVAVALGLMLSPKLDARRPMQPVTGDPMQIVVSGRPNTPLPAAVGGRLETLPPDMARAAAAANPRPMTPTPVQTGAAPAPVAAPATPVSLPAQPSPASYACDGNLSRAEAMICRNPRLAAADQRMKRAWQKALASGADPGRLRRDQRNWLEDREDAALDGPQAVEALYSERIRDLDDIAANGDEDDGDWRN